MLTILEEQPRKVVPTPLNIPSSSQYEINQLVETLTADVLSWCRASLPTTLQLNF